MSREKESYLLWEATLCPSIPGFTHASRLSSSVNFSMTLSPLILDKHLSLWRTPKTLYTPHGNCYFDIYLYLDVDLDR